MKQIIFILLLLSSGIVQAKESPWILLIVHEAKSPVQGSARITTQEFSTRANCEDAIRKSIAMMKDIGIYQGNTRMECILK